MQSIMREAISGYQSSVFPYTKLPMYLSINHKHTYIVSTDVPFENKYFNRAVSLAIRRAVGERSLLAKTATTNAKTSTAATTNAETERSFVALVVIILTATRHLARRLVPRSNEPANKPTNERTNHRTNQRTNEGKNTTNECTNDNWKVFAQLTNLSLVRSSPTPPLPPPPPNQQ